nr:LP11479p [Drosophila melanogaster]
MGCEVGHHAGYLPYTYPSYDYTNMSGNSHFEKPLGIDELPKEFCGLEGAGGGGASTTSEHSSSLPSPQPLTHHQQLHHFESFDAASEHNLLAAQPMSPGSPLSGSVNPAGDDFVQMHHYHHANSPHSQSHHSHAHTHTHGHHVHHLLNHPAYDLTDDQFRLGSALKRVRKRARKYTDFLRKK